MSFQRIPKNNLRSSTPAVVVNQQGFRFNQAAACKFNLRETKYLSVWFDPDARRVAMKATDDPEEEDTFNVQYYSHCTRIYPKTFINAFKLKHGTYKARWLDDSQTYFVFGPVDTE
jgi:hypothetical protein